MVMSDVVQRGFDQPVPRIVGVFVRTIVSQVAVIVVGWGNRRTAEGAGDHQVVPGIVDVVIGIAVITHLERRKLGLLTRQGQHVFSQHSVSILVDRGHGFNVGYRSLDPRL
jgi:hypothetical protein